MLVIPMVAGMAAMGLIFAGVGGGGSAGTSFRWITGVLLGISMVGIIAVQFTTAGSGASKQEMQAGRREYLFDLAQQRREVRATMRKQRAAEYYAHPDPDSLWSMVDGVRLWERRFNDADFGQIRLGLGPRELAATLTVPPPLPMEKAEPVSAMALRRFIEAYRHVPDLPVILALNGFARIYLRGDIRQTRALARAIVAQSAVWHAPDDIMVAACAGPKARVQWEYLKWLPHALHPSNVDALGPVRLITPSVVALEAITDDILAARPRFDPSASETSFDGAHLVVIVDGADRAGSDHLLVDGGVEGVTVIDLDGDPPRNLDRATVVLDIGQSGELTATSYSGTQKLGKADSLGLVAAEALALQLSPLRLASGGGSDDRAMNSEHGLADLLQLGDPEQLNPAIGWQPRPNRERLRVPIGVGADGARVELDIKESAQDGMGPHGLLIGATGSGKSELLRTLVLSLAITNSPEVLNFVLVDFKGGATFVKLDRLPHTSAVITNLADELPLVDRMTDAINGELVRRQELLRAAGNFVSQRDYERARASGVPLDPLPTLLVVCDEFSELLSAKPDFIDMFVQIGRLGRSLGVHLLLASQRLEEGRLRGLDTHLSYRIGLRTFSPMESRSVLGVTDAYELPRAPGHGFLKFGTEPLERFRAAYVSGAYRRPEELTSTSVGDVIYEYSSTYVAGPANAAEPAAADPMDDTEVDGDTLLDILTSRLTGHGTPAHRVWLPPLGSAPALGEIMGVGPWPRAGGGLKAVAGIVDKPFEQRRDLLGVDLSGAAGHLVAVGAPQSGKSSLLRTLVMSLALAHSPDEVQFYGLDFGGGALSSLRELPHFGGIASRRDVNEVRRTIAELEGLLHQREQSFVELGIDGMATFRRIRAAGQLPGDRFGDVFLVIDGWATIRSEFEDLEERITILAMRGLSYGIHLLLTAARWPEVRGSLRDAIASRLELRLGDPSDSAIDRRSAANVPQSAPGRGITPDRYQFLAALPRMDQSNGLDDLPEALTVLIKQISAAWPGKAAPKVRLLPPMVPFELLPQLRTQPGPAVAIAEHDLSPVSLDFFTDPHLYLFGDVESGKSAFLRTLANGLAARFTPAEARFFFLDYRRANLGLLPQDHLLGYATSAAQATEFVRDVVTAMNERVPGPDITPEQLRKRDWWKGPDVFVIVDDYDLVAGDRNPVALLAELLPQAREIGLHLIIARRSGGASRSFYDPALARLRELGSPAAIMSADRNEGQLVSGVRSGPLPAGRAWLQTRKEGLRLVQFGWLENEPGSI